jgi:hypothetical protein
MRRNRTGSGLIAEKNTSTLPLNRADHNAFDKEALEKRVYQQNRQYNNDRYGHAY